MPRPHISMRKIRDLLRLSFGDGLSLRQVAASLQMPYTTVAEHVRRAKAAGLSWPLPEGLDDDALEVGVLEEREGDVHLVAGGADSITALLLIRQLEGPPRRIVYELPGASSPVRHETSLERAVSTHPSRAERLDRGRSGLRRGETLAERAERLRRR